MNIRTARDVIAIAEARGFRVRLNPGPPPMPVLVKPAGVDRAQATDALMAALKAWRAEIIEELNKFPNEAGSALPNESKPAKAPDEWRAKEAEQHDLSIEVMMPDGSIQGRAGEPALPDPAMYWRLKGELAWRVILLPGREIEL